MRAFRVPVLVGACGAQIKPEHTSHPSLPDGSYRAVVRVRLSDGRYFVSSGAGIEIDIDR